MKHPYDTLPARAFWSKSVSTNWHPQDTIVRDRPLVCPNDKVVSAGSCFAANLIPYLENAGFTYLRTEALPKSFGAFAVENLSYGRFSAAYGNIYTARQMKQLLLRCLGRFHPAEDRWTYGDEIVDPFRPGLRYKARSHEEFDILSQQHLECALRAFATADVLIYTLGLTEAWMSRIDGAVFPACPGTVAGSFDAEKHVFHNFTASETFDDLRDFILMLRGINPSVRIILTVSPVPLVATATSQHVLVATTYSKCALRVAAHDAALFCTDVCYFPAYEIVTGPQAPESFFETSRRNVTKEAVEAVMSAFLAACQVDILDTPLERLKPEMSPEAGLSAALIRAECEEEFADPVIV